MRVHWRRYAFTLLGLGAAVWGVAHGISYFHGKRQRT
jgi:DMSO/TMAO reductase YedYZ heme-binding membrane subunit